jgi:hypothetical protein
VIEPDGTFVLYERGLVPSALKCEFSTCGAGEEFLMGCMAAGASAERAVELAIKYHDSAAGSVVTLHLDDIETQVEESVSEMEEIADEMFAHPHTAVEKFLEERGLG